MSSDQSFIFLLIIKYGTGKGEEEHKVTGWMICIGNVGCKTTNAEGKFIVYGAHIIVVY